MKHLFQYSLFALMISVASCQTGNSLDGIYTVDITDIKNKMMQDMAEDKKNDEFAQKMMEALIESIKISIQIEGDTLYYETTVEDKNVVFKSAFTYNEENKTLSYTNHEGQEITLSKVENGFNMPAGKLEMSLIKEKSSDLDLVKKYNEQN